MKVTYSFERPPIMESADRYRSLKIAMCQIETVPWDLEGNLKRTKEALIEAAAQGSEYAITPECVLHGYADNQGTDSARLLKEQAQPLDGKIVTEIRELVRQLSITVTIGFAEKTPEGLFHNTALMIDPNGDIVDIYRKVHLRPFEDIRYDGFFTAGDEFNVRQVTGRQGPFPVGTFICFDREIPESARALRILGAGLIACPLATMTERFGESDFIENEIVTQVRSAENEVCIAVINHAGRFNGGSFITGPGGELIIQLDEKPQVRTIDIPLEAVQALYQRSQLGWMGLGYRRTDVYEKYL